MKINKHQEFVDFIQWFVQMFQVQTYVEIGVQKGYIFNRIAKLVPRVVGVDILPFTSTEKHEFFHMKSDDFAKVWKDPIDLLFIDADHEKNQVLRDFDNIGVFVKEGTGFIFLHDTHPVREMLLSREYCHNAWEAAWEIRTNEKYRENFEIATFVGPWAGLSIIRKSKKQLAWRG